MPGVRTFCGEVSGWRSKLRERKTKGYFQQTALAESHYGKTIYALAALASAGAAVLAWIAKIRWANEYKQAKEAQLEAKEAQLETVKELTSTRVLTEFRALKEMFEESSRMREKQLQELKEQLGNELLSKSELIEQISGMNAEVQFQRDELQARLKELETSLENDFKNVTFFRIPHHGSRGTLRPFESEIQRIESDETKG